MKGMMEALEPLYGKITVPIVAYHGDTDRCTEIDGVKRLLEQCGSSDKELVVMEGGYHMLLEGPEKEEVATKIVDWMLARL